MNSEQREFLRQVKFMIRIMTDEQWAALQEYLLTFDRPSPSVSSLTESVQRPKRNWTPGPWNVGLDGSIYGSDGLVLLHSTLRTVRGELILAAAAPELYEALEEIVEALDDAYQANPEAYIEFFSEIVTIREAYRQRFKAVLTKARGEGQ